MLNVALTGNIAAGKSTVVGLFRSWGATVIDADQLAREAQRPGTDVLSAIAFRFGRDVLLEGGELDRAALRGKVMGDEEALASLNAIVHPAVRRERDALIERAIRRGDLIVVNDIPLLFESADPDAFDVVVLVDASPAARRQRLMARRGLAEDEADKMIAAQLSSQRKRDRSHYVIDNDGSLDDLRTAAAAVWDALRQHAAREARESGLEQAAVLVGLGRRWVATCGGTIARLATSGVGVHVVWTGGDPGSEVAGQLSHVASVLGATLHVPENLSATRTLLEALRPEVIIAAVPDDVLDELVVEAGTVVLRPERRRQATVALDVRPWLAAKARALEAYPDGPRLEERDATERFRDEFAAAPRLTLLRTGSDAQGA